MVTFGPVTKRQFTLIPAGEYVWTLDDISELEGDFGTRLVWDFFVAEKETPTEYLTQEDGKVKTIKMFTDVDITLGSRQLEWMQALTGRTFGEGANLPDGSELLSKRMLGYLNHYTPKRGKNTGVAREDLVSGSCNPFALPKSKANGTARPAPGQVSSDPTSEEIDRALLVTKLQKQTARLMKLDADQGKAAEAAVAVSDLDTAPLSDLEALLNQVSAAVTAALDA